MSIPAHDLESMKVTLTQALQIVETLTKQQVLQDEGISSEQQPDEVLTIPQLMARLKIGKPAIYDLISEPGCPVHSIGGPKQKRVIWSEFLEWFKQRKGAS